MDRNCGPMNKNRIEGGADQGEQANGREVLVIKGRRRKSGGRAVKECVLTWGDLAFMPERVTAKSRSEKSDEAVVVHRNAKEEAEREGVILIMAMCWKWHQTSALAKQSQKGAR